MNEESLQSVFVVAGEASGDRIGAWYLGKLREGFPSISAQAIGGSHLEAAGATLYAHSSTLNVVGVIEIIRHIPRLLRQMNRLVRYIIEHNFDTVILVDFPGFNLRLAKLLKRSKPTLHIIYCSPPQLWIWGRWRLKAIKAYVDRVIVLYPFEVAWYRERGVVAEWLGYPGYERFASYASLQSADMVAHKKPCIALLVGSRQSEVEMMMPLCKEVIAYFSLHHPEVRFIIPRASTIAPSLLETSLVRYNLRDAIAAGTLRIIDDTDNSSALLAECVVALAKPGTNTLELALHGVPTVITFKTSPLTFFIAKRFVHVRYMGIVNLLLSKELSPEFIQSAATPAALCKALDDLYSLYNRQPSLYTHIVEDYLSLHRTLESALKTH